MEGQLLELLTDNPLEANLGFLVGSAVAFFLVECGANPKVRTFMDALYYTSTCLAVGYTDIFLVTQRGKAIATLVMTVGPALTAELLDPPQRAAGPQSTGREKSSRGWMPY